MPKSYEKDGCIYESLESRNYHVVQQYQKAHGGTIIERDKASQINKARGRHEPVFQWKKFLRCAPGLDTCDCGQ